MTVVRCGRLDRHEPHEWPSRPIGANWPVRIQDCPGVVTIEGGALDTHDCGARVHPAEVRDCPCGRCVGTLCPACEPCRRVS